MVGAVLEASSAHKGRTGRNTCWINKGWVLTLQVIVPEVASAVMVSPTKTFTQSPAEWVGAAVLIAYGIVAGLVGTSILRRRDIA